jgi:hypothetical protein
MLFGALITWLFSIVGRNKEKPHCADSQMAQCTSFIAPYKIAQSLAD